MSILASAHRILIVEHDPQLSEILAALLHLEGYETDVATTLEDALNNVDEHLYDFVLTDLLAPAPPSPANPAQLSVVQRLRQHCHPIPVGILTGWRLDQEVAERAGFAFALQKPFDIQVVMQRITDRLNVPFAPEHQPHVQLIGRFMQAISTGDWETTRALCTPGFGYYRLNHSLFTEARAIIGIEAFLAYVQMARQHFPGVLIEQVVIFQQRARLIARYTLSWQGPGNQRHRITGSMQYRFQGEQLSQIGQAMNARRLRELLEPPQPHATALSSESSTGRRSISP